VLDCETAPCDYTIDEVTPINMLAYDIGWVVVDKRGRVYKQRSFVNANVFLEEKELMKSSYYADKISQYWDDIKTGHRILTTFYNIRQALIEDIETFSITEVFAHNMSFDYGALNNTQRWLTKSKYRYFFPKNVDICDTLKLARQLIGTMPTYKKWCENNDYLTKNNRVKLTAEILYRFISGEDKFTESHTGLEDCMIEKEILAYCYKKHKPMDYILYERREGVA